jgi:hypothetical protein
MFKKLYYNFFVTVKIIGTFVEGTSIIKYLVDKAKLSS